MSLCPGSPIRTPAIGLVCGFRPEHGLDGVIVLNEQFGVIINGAFELIVAVVERQSLGWGMEIDSSLMLLEPGPLELERRIVAVVDDHGQSCVTSRGKRYFLIV